MTVPLHWFNFDIMYRNSCKKVVNGRRMIVPVGFKILKGEKHGHTDDDEIFRSYEDSDTGFGSRQKSI